MLQYVRDARVCLSTRSEKKDTLVKGTRVGEEKNTLVKGMRAGNLIEGKKERSLLSRKNGLWEVLQRW